MTEHQSTPEQRPWDAERVNEWRAQMHRLFINPDFADQLCDLAIKGLRSEIRERGECHDAAERNEGCFRALKAERELAEMTEEAESLKMNYTGEHLDGSIAARSSTAPTTAEEVLRDFLQIEDEGGGLCVRNELNSSDLVLALSDARKVLDTPRSARPAKCSWHLDGEDSDTYATGCGQYYCFSDGTLEECEARYCQGCGGKIDLVANDDRSAT